MTKHRILIAEDQDIARLGLRLTLEKMPDVEVIGEAVDGDSVLVQVEQFQPGIILMDINLPGISGIQATKLIKNSHPYTAIIMFTSDSSDEAVFAALRAGADGYCLKNIAADQLQIAIESVAKGAAWLDPAIAQRVLRRQALVKSEQNQEEIRAKSNLLLDVQQQKLLELIEKGWSLEKIAEHLQINVSSVERELRTLLTGLTAGTEKTAQIKQSNTNTPEIDPSLPIVPGMILSQRFMIESVIGSGGMSTVYRGKDLSIGRIVAIKMLHQKALTEEAEIQRFLREAKTASAISHPNVITIFDFGLTSSGQPYIVMDYIDGISMEDLIKEKKLTVSQTLKILVQVCDALGAAHRKGIIHRDLKPSNIMLIKDDDGQNLVKLVDFGMAKFLIESEDLKLSKTGDLFGTPLYMSPEHFRSEKLDQTSDIYALGCVLYEALTGAPPFNGTSLYEVMNYHLNEAPSRLPFMRHEVSVPAELESLLFRMLAKNPKDRPQSMAEIKTTFLNCLKLETISE